MAYRANNEWRRRPFSPLFMSHSLGTINDSVRHQQIVSPLRTTTATKSNKDYSPATINHHVEGTLSIDKHQSKILSKEKNKTAFGVSSKIPTCCA